LTLLVKIKKKQIKKYKKKEITLISSTAFLYLTKEKKHWRMVEGGAFSSGWSAPPDWRQPSLRRRGLVVLKLWKFYLTANLIYIEYAKNY
jgi:hypothetical protein